MGHQDHRQQGDEASRHIGGNHDQRGHPGEHQEDGDEAGKGVGAPEERVKVGGLHLAEAGAFHCIGEDEVAKGAQQAAVAHDEEEQDGVGGDPVHQCGPRRGEGWAMFEVGPALCRHGCRWHVCRVM